MSKKFKIFLMAFFVSLPVFWGTNFIQGRLENFLFAQVYLEPQIFLEKPRVLTAQIVPQPETEPFNINAKAALSAKIKEDGNWEILYEKNMKTKLPIASLTKLMTALVVLNNYDLGMLVKISKAAVDQEEILGQLKIDEILSVDDLLHIMLMESSNDAAYALAEVIGVENFINAMNWEAKNLGLKNTFFVNPTGLNGSENYSSVQDLAILTKNLLNKPIIWEILRTPEYNLYLSDPDSIEDSRQSRSGKLHHKLINSNDLLNEQTSWQSEIWGGKTGWNPEASGCLLLVLKTGENEYLVNVILGSDDRFGEMKKLISSENQLSWPK